MPTTVPCVISQPGGRFASAAASQAHCLQLRAAAYAVAMPLVWERHTRPLENIKGHRRCASGVVRLAPECHDGFTDDLESVVTALLSYQKPIVNLEGWISARMANAIKDGYRVRRATEMGAQQRVRVPVRLAARLNHDPWLIRLAERVLQWVGVRHTAGVGLWPVRAWAEERVAQAGPVPDPYTAVEEDLDVVLGAMRAIDPAWFDMYVERPLGRKWAPVAAGWPESGRAAPARMTSGSRWSPNASGTNSASMTPRPEACRRFAARSPPARRQRRPSLRLSPRISCRRRAAPRTRPGSRRSRPWKRCGGDLGQFRRA